MQKRSGAETAPQRDAPAQQDAAPPPRDDAKAQPAPDAAPAVAPDPDAAPGPGPAPDAAALPYDSSIPVLLLRAREAMMRNFRPVLAAEGFTEQQWRVLRTLAADGAMDAAALSERSVILPPSLTRILQALEARGYLERRRDEADRRRTLCRLTETGRKRVETLAPRTAKVHAALEARFGAERSAALHKLLREIAELD